jgi:hypothetical protein
MSAQTIGFAITGAILGRLPTLLILGTGMVVALSKRRRHPRVSLVALIGLTVLLLNSLASGFLGLLLPTLLRERGSAVIGYVMATANLAGAIISGVGIGFLLWAVYMEREQAPRALQTATEPWEAAGPK